MARVRLGTIGTMSHNLFLLNERARGHGGSCALRPLVCSEIYTCQFALMHNHNVFSTDNKN